MTSLTKVKALIRNLSKQKDINAQILLKNYMLERILERIAASNYRENFVLKGGMLITALVGVDLRSTIDMDTTIKSISLSENSVRNVLSDILLVPLDDGVTFSIKTIEEIRGGSDYSGYRVSIIASLEEAKVPIKIDITTGDKITPKEISYKFDLMFEPRTIEIFAYPIETVLAEKLETTLVRGTANTRMRDYYDIHILLQLKGHLISDTSLTSALIKTATQRSTTQRLTSGEDILSQIKDDSTLQSYWKNYQRKNSYVGELSWEEIMESLFQLWRRIQIKKDM